LYVTSGCYAFLCFFVSIPNRMGASQSYSIQAATERQKSRVGKFQLRTSETYSVKILSRLLEMLLDKNNLIDLAKALDSEDKCRSLIVGVSSLDAREFTQLRLPDPQKATQFQLTRFITNRDYAAHQLDGPRVRVCKDVVFFMMRLVTLVAALTASISTNADLAALLRAPEATTGSVNTSLKINKSIIGPEISSASFQFKEIHPDIVTLLERSNNFRRVDTRSFYYFGMDPTVIIDTSRGIVFLGRSSGTTPVMRISISQSPTAFGPGGAPGYGAGSAAAYGAPGYGGTAYGGPAVSRVNVGGPRVDMGAVTYGAPQYTGPQYGAPQYVFQMGSRTPPARSAVTRNFGMQTNAAGRAVGTDADDIENVTHLQGQRPTAPVVDLTESSVAIKPDPLRGQTAPGAQSQYMQTLEQLRREVGDRYPSGPVKAVATPAAGYTYGTPDPRGALKPEPARGLVAAATQGYGPENYIELPSAGSPGVVRARVIGQNNARSTTSTGSSQSHNPFGNPLFPNYATTRTGASGGNGRRTRKGRRSAERKSRRMRRGGGASFMMMGGGLGQYEFTVQVMPDCGLGTCEIQTFYMDETGQTYNEKRAGQYASPMITPFTQRMLQILSRPTIAQQPLAISGAAPPSKYAEYAPLQAIDAKTHERLTKIGTDIKTLPEGTSPAIYRAFLLASDLTPAGGGAPSDLLTTFCSDRWQEHILTDTVAYSLLQSLFFDQLTESPDVPAISEASRRKLQSITGEFGKFMNRATPSDSPTQLNHLRFPSVTARLADFCKLTEAKKYNTPEEIERLTSAHKQLRDLYDKHIVAIVALIRKVLSLKDTGFESLPRIQLDGIFMKHERGAIYALEQIIDEARTLLSRHYLAVETVYDNTLKALSYRKIGRNIANIPAVSEVATESTTPAVINLTRM
jgi:hypothetical protein